MDQIIENSASPVEEAVMADRSGLFFLRWAATVIDFILLFVIGLPFFVFHGFTFKLLFLIPVYIISQYLILEAFTGYTAGKFILRVKAVDKEGNPPGFVKGLIRTLLRIIEINPFLLGGLPAGILVLSTKKKQRLGDMAAGTYVVRVADLIAISGKTALPSEDVQTFSNTGKDKKVRAELLSLAAALLLMAASITYIALTPSESMPLLNASHQKTITTEDGVGQIDIPGTWNVNEDAVDADTAMAVQHLLSGTYLMIKNKSKVENPSQSIDDYVDNYDTALSSRYDILKLIDTQDVEVCGQKGRQYHYSCEYDGDKFIIYLVVGESKDYFHIMFAVCADPLDEYDKDELMKVIASYRLTNQGT